MTYLSHEFDITSKEIGRIIINEGPSGGGFRSSFPHTFLHLVHVPAFPSAPYYRLLSTAQM